MKKRDIYHDKRSEEKYIYVRKRIRFFYSNLALILVKASSCGGGMGLLKVRCVYLWKSVEA